MKNYETVVGLEIHAHLKTDSKMFCSCSTGPKRKEYKMSVRDEPNVRVCPICTGNPGTLPVPNAKAIEDTILLGLALGSEIPKKFNFERKNYYYPDLPKAYQITSATNPPVVGGGLEIESPEGSKFVKLDHIHLEEDAGKLTHDKSGDYSLVDLNRAGTPLLEIVTSPDMSSGHEAAEFMRNLQAILRTLDISDADMEKGQMRCDANISVRKEGEKELGVKVEVKNINSFKMVQKAIDFETNRQIEALENGEVILQETRGWSEAKGKTLGQRSKEFANDYRYFPEPDIPPIETGVGTPFDPKKIADRLPELPKEKKVRFISEYGLKPQDAEIVSSNLETAKYFEAVIENIPEEAENTEFKKEIGKMVTSFILTEFLAKLEGADSIFDTKVTPESLAELIAAQKAGDISGKMAKDIFTEMFKTGKGAKSLISEKGAAQISDAGELNNIVTQTLKDNPAEVERYRNGEKQLFGFFVGQVMKASGGQANPVVVNEILKKELK
jgi:aspartyl-tRNA(Asn)/glutamyl-tRNA(Gln) amidotransferase subunit B